MAAVAQVSSSLLTSRPIRSVFVSSPARANPISRIPVTNFTPIGTSFSTGSPLLIQGTYLQKTVAGKATGISIRCEQGAKDGSGLDVWLGRLAMVGFAVAITVEISTGKGLLENFGLTSPLPTVALAVTALVGVLTAIFIFQSASDK